MGAQENECQISQNYILHMKFSEFYLCNHNSCNKSSVVTPKKISYGSARKWMSNFTSLALEKCKKECNIV